MSFEVRRHAPLLVVAWWAALMIAVVAVRPLTPVDETRVVSVAWEMRLSGDWLLLRLNGAMYGHKPPLLMWLINVGWSVFGVSESLPRWLTGCFGLGSLALLWSLARRLTHGRDDIATLSILIAGSTVGWMVFTGAVMYDLALSFFVLLAALNIARAAQGARFAWVMVGVALGLGILTKGPVALLHVLPLALLGPWWVRRDPAAAARSWGHWYSGVGIAVVVGATIALVWAVPTAVAGGEAFRNEIFWSQSVDRMVSTIQHAAPIWYYLAFLPLLLFPWLLMPSIWRGFVALVRSERSDLSRFALAWSIPVLVAFSFFKSKLIYYLLPVTPAFALLAANGMAALAKPAGRADRWVMAAILVVTALALIVVPQVPRTAHLISPGEVPLLWISAGALAVLAVAAAIWRSEGSAATAATIGSTAVLMVVAMYAGIGRAALDTYDLHPVARVLAVAQQNGRPIAHHGKYHGQFQFIGRLERPLEVVQLPDDLRLWAERHPEGSVVVYSYRPLEHVSAAPQVMQKFKGRYVYVWRGADLAGVSDGWTRGRPADEGS
ncbi:MAG: ArnT family glycosyltransferase [Burkholderiaceae bacterium]